MLLRLGLCPHNMGKQTNGVAFVTTSLSLVPLLKSTGHVQMRANKNRFIDSRLTHNIPKNQTN